MLDVGCGTGRLALALTERGCKVWGVDPSGEMLAQARKRAGRRVNFSQGAAEALPFGEAAFERAALRLVIHLVDRDRGLAELARVLISGGKAVLATFRPEHFERFWLSPFFPSIPKVDGARFPRPEELVDELRAAGFAAVRARSLSQRRTASREEALERIRGRFISTLQLVSEDEFHQGLAKAERELPAEVEYSLEWAILTAER